jgi:hypothetical protein
MGTDRGEPSVSSRKIPKLEGDGVAIRARSGLSNGDADHIGGASICAVRGALVLLLLQAINRNAM